MKELPTSLRSRVHLHRTALSNYTGTTELFDAATSSSLLKGAVVNGAIEERKFLRSGQRVEVVPVTTLDDHFRSLASSRSNGDSSPVLSVVGMKIDTQGVEPEILMGAQSILGNPASRPRVVVIEYFTRFRAFDELSVGLRLLIGLGYYCYYEQGAALGTSMVVTPETEFEGDFYCTHKPLIAPPNVAAKS
jgi:hypothetical protein